MLSTQFKSRRKGSPPSGNRPHRGWLGPLVAWSVALSLGSSIATASPIQNVASGTFGGHSLDPGESSVSLNRVGGPVTDAVFEVDPSTVPRYGRNRNIRLFINPTLRPGDLGIETAYVSFGDGLDNFELQALVAEGDTLHLGTGDEGGEYSKTVEGNVLRVDFAKNWSLSGAPIAFDVTLDVVGGPGPVELGVEVHAGTRIVQARAGNADGDPNNANSGQIEILPGVDPERSLFFLDPAVVLADGAEISTVTAVLLGPDGEPFAEKQVRFESSRGSMDTIGQPIAATDVEGRVTGWVKSSTIGASTLTAVDVTDGIELAAHPVVAFSQGAVLQIEKKTESKSLVTGDVAVFEVEIRNLTDQPAEQVKIRDRTPAGFQYLAGTARLDGEPVSDPTPNDVLVFQIGEVAASKEGQESSRLLSYTLVAGSNVHPGTYENTAVAVDACEQCEISNRSIATIDVVPDEFFETSLILGKVFQDVDANGVQQNGEPGIAGVRVVMDDGAFAITDSFGRFHLERIESGQRLIKIDTGRLGDGVRVVDGLTRTLTVTPGLPARVVFGIVDTKEVQSIGAPAVQGYALRANLDPRPVDVVGYLTEPGIVINGSRISPPQLRVEARQAKEIAGVGEAFGILEIPFRIEGSDVSAQNWAVRKWTLEVCSASAGDVLGHSGAEGEVPGRVSVEVRSDVAAASVGMKSRLVIEYENGVLLSTPWTSVGVRMLPNDWAVRTNQPVQVGEAVVRIDGAPVDPQADGRFATEWRGTDGFEFDLLVEDGTRVGGTIQMPALQFGSPVSDSLGLDDPALTIVPDSTASTGATVSLNRTMSVRTDSGNRVMVDGTWVNPDANGVIEIPISATEDGTELGLLLESPSGVRRVYDLSFGLEPVVLEPAIPQLDVSLPDDQILASPLQTVVGRTDPGNRIFVNGQPSQVRDDGRFQSRVELPVGESLLRVEVVDPDGNRGTLEEEVAVSGTRFFLVALADATVGRFRGTGDLVGAGMESRNETFSDGRVAYYIEGSIAGNVLVRSAFDTGRRELDSLFDDLGAYDEARLLTYLDPDASYSVFGDTSEEGRAADTPGKFYLAIESESLDLLYGTFAPSTVGTELATYRRVLHGGRLRLRTPVEPSFATELEAFFSEEDRVHLESEFEATGGSLYYLPHGDVVEGSEQVTIVVRHSETGLPLLELPVHRDSDYRISYSLGRIWFDRPLPSVTESSTLLDTDVLPGHPVYVRIGYDSQDASGDSETAGGRVVQQLGRYLKLGATYVREKTGTEESELRGFDVSAELSFARLIAEYAETEGADSLEYVSGDGGLTFGRIGSGGESKSGAAWKVAGEIDIARALGKNFTFGSTAYARRAERGFRSTASLAAVGREQYGASLRAGNERVGVFELRSDRTQILGVVGVSEEAERVQNSVRWSWSRSERAEFAFEMRGERSENSAGTELDSRDDVAARIRSRLRDGLTGSLEREQALNGVKRDRTTLALDYDAGGGFVLGARGSTGSDGESATGRVRYDRLGRQYYIEGRTDWSDASPTRTTTWGARQRLGDDAIVYSEYQWFQGGTGEKNLQVWGAERRWVPTAGLTLELQGEHARTDAAATDLRRSTLGATVNFTEGDRVDTRARGEVRVEDGTSDRTQYLTDNRLELSLNPDWALLGRMRWSRTTDRRTDRTEASHAEHSVGLAYRPVAQDHVNALGRYTHARDDRPGDSRLDGRTRDVISVEGAYGFRRWGELVGRFGARWQETEIASQDQIHTFTYLTAGRLNLRILGPVGLGTEYRVFAQREAEDQRRGWLNELTWDPVDYVRLGLGYDFTDFEDDLDSEDDYTKRGWFLRLQGRY